MESLETKHKQNLRKDGSQSLFLCTSAFFIRVDILTIQITLVTARV